MPFERKDDGLKSYKELHATLVQEVLKREQHRLNYDKLKALNTKLQLELEEKKRKLPEQVDQDIRTEKKDGNNKIEAEFQEYNPYHRLLLGIPDVRSDKDFRPSTTIPQLLSPDSKHLDQGLQGLEALLEKKIDEENPSEHLKSGFWESSEMLATLNQWKRDYTALYQEFQNYQDVIRATAESEVAAANEKITLLEDEIRVTRTELEKEKFDLDTTCRELIREKSSLQCEIRTLREELDETRLKLEEKTSQNEVLSRKMDGTMNKNLSQVKGDCQDRSHVALNSRLNAADLRTGFLEHEIQDLIKGKETLLEEMNEMTRRHDRKVEQLNKHIQHLEHLFSQERKDFEVKYNDVKCVMKTQQACIIEMEEVMKSKEDESSAFVEGVHNQMRDLMADALQTITSMEEDKSATASNQEKLAQEVAIIQAHINNLKEAIKVHQQYCISLCTQALVLLNCNEFDPSNTNSFLENTRNEIPKIFTHESNINVNKNSKELEEETLKKLLQAIVNSKEQFRHHQDRLQSRIQELEYSLKTDKLQYCTEIESSQKKCKMYSRLIRKLRKRLEHSQNLATSKGGVIAKNDTNAREHTNGW